MNRQTIGAPHTSWSRTVGRSASEVSQGKRQHPHPPLPWPRDQAAGKDPSASLATMPASTDVTTDGDSSYESDDNLSIAASFTRSVAALNLCPDSEGDDADDDEISFAPKAAVSSKPLGASSEGAPFGKGDTQSTFGNSVSESWDDDFVFPQDESRKASNAKASIVGRSDRASTATSDDGGSAWDSDENPVIGSRSKVDDRHSASAEQNHKLHRMASSRTIVPHDEGETRYRALLGHVQERSPIANVNADTAAPHETRSPRLSSSDSIKAWRENHRAHRARIADARGTLAQPDELRQTSPSTAPETSPLRHSSIQSPYRERSPPNVKAERQITLPEHQSKESPSQKKTSLGSSEGHWSKLFSAKIRRRKATSISQGEHNAGKGSAPTSAERRAKNGEEPQVPLTPSRARLSTTLQQSPHAGHMSSPSTATVSLSRPASSPRPSHSPSSSIFSSSALSGRETRMDKGSIDTGPMSERRQWASRLDDSPPDREVRTLRTGRSRMETKSGQELSSIKVKDVAGEESERRVSKRKISDADSRPRAGLNMSQAQDTIRPLRPVPSSPSRKDASSMFGHRSFSSSTTTSAISSSENTHSAASSTLTEATSDTSPASHNSHQRTAITPRRHVSTESSTAEDPSRNSLDTRQTQLSRSSVPHRPPPVSSGLDSLARRKSKHPTIPTAFASDTADDDASGLPQQSGTSNDSAHQRSNSRRNSFSDLQIPVQISKAQNGLRADMERIRNFASGIEDLKGLRDARQRVVDRLSESRDAERRLGIERELERCEYTYGSWWECAEVLIGLADGKEHSLGDGKDTSVNQRRPRMSPTPSVHSSHGMHQGSVRRHEGQVSSSRASSSASRYVPPDRERDILAAMLAGTPPEHTSPARASHGDHRQRTVSIDQNVRRTSRAHTKSQSTAASQRPSVEVRRTSDPIFETGAGSHNGGSNNNAVLFSTTYGSPQKRSVGTSSPIISSDHGIVSQLDVSILRQGSGGRRRLRSAGQIGLQGLRDLVSTIRTNSTLGARSGSRSSQVSLHHPARQDGSRPSSRENQASSRRSTSGSDTMPRSQREGSNTLSPAERPSLYRASASLPAGGSSPGSAVHPVSSRVASGSSVKSSGADSLVVDTSLDSEWTEAELDTSIQSAHNRFSIDSTEADSSHYAGPAHNRAFSALAKALPGVSRRRDRSTIWAGSTTHSASRSTSTLAWLKNRSEASLPRPATAVTEAAPSVYRTPPTAGVAKYVSIDRRTSQPTDLSRSVLFEASTRPMGAALIEQGSAPKAEYEGSTESDWTSYSGQGRMRVMSADHVDVAAQRAEAASDAFRKLAMRPEAIPSLNRYLDVTRARCRESLSILKDFEAEQEAVAT